MNQPKSVPKNISVACVLFCILAYFFLIFSDWNLFSRFGIRGQPNFMDAWVLFSYAECAQVGDLRIYEEENLPVGCDGIYPYGYGSFTLFEFVKWLGITPSLFGYSLFFIVFGILMIFALHLRYQTIFKAWTPVSIICTALSPGILLLFERGNLDGLMFILCLAASLTLAWGLKHVAFVTLLLSASMKFYTAPLLLLFLLTKRRQRLIYCATLIPLMPMIIFNFTLVKSKVFETWFMSFGFYIWEPYLNQLTLKMAPEILSIIKILQLLFYLVTLFYLRKILDQGNLPRLPLFKSFIHPWHQAIFFVCSLIWLFSFFVGINFDYRMIFLLMALLALDKVGGDKNRLNYYFVRITLLMVFLGSAFFLPRPLVWSLHLVCDIYLYGVSLVLILIIWNNRGSLFALFESRETKFEIDMAGKSPK